MKKRVGFVVAVAVAAAIAVSCVCVAVLGRENPAQSVGGKVISVALSDANVRKGESFDVNVNVLSNPGIISMKLNVEYDASCLTLTGVDDKGVLGNYSFGTVYSSPYVMLWSNGAATENITATGSVATLHFKANSDYSGDRETKIKVTASGSNDIFDIDMSRGGLTLEATDGNVSIRDNVAHSIRAEKSADQSETGAYQSAGLRFRASVDDDDAVGATEIGFAVVRTKDVSDGWYKRDASAAGVLSAFAYSKQENINIVYNDADGYNEYQLVLTGLTREGITDRNLKSTEFSVYMWIRYSADSGKEEYKYIDLGSASYVSVFEEYKAAGIDVSGY